MRRERGVARFHSLHEMVYTAMYYDLACTATACAVLLSLIVDSMSAPEENNSQTTKKPPVFTPVTKQNCSGTGQQLLYVLMSGLEFLVAEVAPHIVTWLGSRTHWPERHESPCRPTCDPVKFYPALITLEIMKLYYISYISIGYWLPCSVASCDIEFVLMAGYVHGSLWVHSLF